MRLMTAVSPVVILCEVSLILQLFKLLVVTVDHVKSCPLGNDLHVYEALKVLRAVYEAQEDKDCE